MNVENINVLAKALSTHPEEYFPWLVECCKTLELSKTLFLLVLLQSFTLLETGNFMTAVVLALYPRLSFLTMVLPSCIFFNLLIRVPGSATDSNFKNSGLYKLILIFDKGVEWVEEILLLFTVRILMLDHCNFLLENIVFFTFDSSPSLLGDTRFSTFFATCFPILRMEWELHESAGNISEEVAAMLWFFAIHSSR